MSKATDTAKSDTPKADTPKADTTAATSQAATTEKGPYAIVEASGQQFWVQPNRYYDLDRINAEVDSTVTLDNVLLVKDAKGATLGHPFIAGATVELKVMAHRRGPKIIVYKMKPKKETRRKNGHRQNHTILKIVAIGGEEKKAAPKKAAAKKTSTP